MVTEVTSQLFHHASLRDVDVLAYCVMPDHLHALLEKRAASGEFDTIATGFMQATEAAYRAATRRPLWQSGHHQRLLRDDEASDRAARHILENPVRAGLTRAVGEYPFAWSDVYGLESLFPARPRTGVACGRRLRW